MIVLMRMFQWRLANTTSSRVSTDVACRPMCCATESTTVAMVLTRNMRMLDAGVSVIDAHHNPSHPSPTPTDNPPRFVSSHNFLFSQLHHTHSFGVSRSHRLTATHLRSINCEIKGA